jgi:hypothetical protein
MEIAEDLAYSRKVWTFERIGWGLLALLLAAALAGLFGKGPLSYTQLHSDDGWWLDYERFGRRVSPMTLKLHLPASASDQQVQVWLDRQYLAACQIQQITPEPLETRLDADGLVYVFASQAQSDLVQIVFHLEPQEFGFLSGRLGINEEPPLAFDQLIYP